MSDSAADGMTGAGAGSMASSSQATIPANQAQHQPQQPQQQAPSQTPQTQQDVDRIVLNYLNQKGYRKAELALRREANLLTLQELTSLASAEQDAKKHERDDLSSPDAYEQAYLSLRRWVQNSLDLYKVGYCHFFAFDPSVCMMLHSTNMLSSLVSIH
jgi:transcription initiation factor TFIID subunit 5